MSRPHRLHNGSSESHPQQSVSAPPSHPAEETLLQEVAAFTPASHLFWALWSIVQSQVSTIPFGYMVRG